MNDENMKYGVAKAVKSVRTYRDDKWEKALKIAKNDFEKASKIYDTV